MTSCTGNIETYREKISSFFFNFSIQEFPFLHYLLTVQLLQYQNLQLPVIMVTALPMPLLAPVINSNRFAIHPKRLFKSGLQNYGFKGNNLPDVINILSNYLQDCLSRLFQTTDPGWVYF